jgi:hypothetical protein
VLDVAVPRLVLENVNLSSGLKRCQRVAVKRGDTLNVRLPAADPLN